MNHDFSRFTLILLISAAAMGCLWGQPTLSDIEEMIEREQYDLAEVALKQMIEQEPRNAQAYYWLGTIYHERAEYYVAESYFRKGIKSQRREPLNHAGLGRVMFASKELEKGRKALEKALKIGKRNAGISLLVAEIYMEEGSEELIKEGEALLLHAAPTGCGDIIPIICNYDRAYENRIYDFHRRMIEIDSTCVFSYVRLAEILISEGKLKEAERYLEKALILDTGFPPTHRYLGELKTETHEQKEFHQYYSKYYQLVGNDRRAATIYAKVLLGLGEYEKMISLLEDLNYQDEQSLRLLTAAYLIEDDYHSAQLSYDKYCHVSTERMIRNGWIFENAYIISDDNSDFGYVRDSLITPDTIALLKEMAAFAKTNKDYVWEVFFREKLIEKMSQPRIREYYHLGTANYLINELKQADSSFIQVLNIKPDFTAAHFWRLRIAKAQDPENEQWLVIPHAQQIIKYIGEKPIKDLKAAEKAQLRTSYQLMTVYQYGMQADGSGNCEAARSWLEKALIFAPEDEDLLGIRANCQP